MSVDIMTIAICGILLLMALVTPLCMKPKRCLDGYHYGGYLSFDLAERWSMDVGMRRYGNNLFHQQWTVPIIRPSYKHNGSEINADFGGMFQQILKGLFFNH